MSILERLSAARVPAERKPMALDSGIIIFCGIGLLLSLFALMCGWFGVEGAVGY